MGDISQLVRILYEFVPKQKIALWAETIQVSISPYRPRDISVSKDSVYKNETVKL